MSTSPKPRPRLRSRLLAACALVAWVARSLWRDPRVFSIEIHTLALLAHFEQLTKRHLLSPEDALESMTVFEQLVKDTKDAQRLLAGSRQARRAQRAEITETIERAQRHLERLRTLSQHHA